MFEDVFCEISTQISYKFYKYKALEIIIISTIEESSVR